MKKAFVLVEISETAQQVVAVSTKNDKLEQFISDQQNAEDLLQQFHECWNHRIAEYQHQYPAPDNESPISRLDWEEARHTWCRQEVKQELNIGDKKFDELMKSSPSYRHVKYKIFEAQFLD